MILRSAQTNLQLWEQLIAVDWGEDDLRRARRAYELAASLFGGRLRPNGKSFLAHVVGVASLLADLGAAPDLVVAALLHSAYTHGDLGPFARDRNAARAFVQAAVSVDVERCVAGYADFEWNREALLTLHRRLSGESRPPLTAGERDLLLLRLADTLEDYGELGELYTRPGAADKNAIFGDDVGLLVEAARALPAPRLAEALDAAIQSTAKASRPAILRSAPLPFLAPRRRRRVLLFCAASRLGGTEKLVASLARHLPRRGFDVRVVFSGPAAVEIAGWCHRHGVAAESIPDVWALGRAQRSATMYRLIRETAADTLNVHYGGSAPSPFDAVAARAAGCSYIASPHLPVLHPVSAPWRVAMWLLARACTAVVVSNETTRDQLVSAGVPAARLRIVPVGVAVPAETPNAPEARRRLGLPIDAYVIGCVAQLERRKGVDVLLAAFGRLPDPERKIHVVVAGRGPEHAALEAQARQTLNGRVHLLGWVDDPTDLYAAADVVALASSWEGVPLTLCEAAAHGVPAVAFDVGGVHRIIRHGTTGLMVPPGDVAALADSLGALLADPQERAKMGAAARLRAIAFSDETMASAYAEILDSARVPM